MKRFILSLAAVLFIGSASMAQNSSNLYTDENGVFLQGYDLVSYYEEDEPKKGSADHSAEYQGAKFYFSSTANKESFEANPEKYLPKYGGHCAFAMGKMAKKVRVDPLTYEFIDGELYLFFNGEMKGKKMNTKKPWDKNQETLKKNADKKWDKMQG